MKFVPKVRVNNIPSLVKIMAWCRPDDKPLSEAMMVSLLVHICVARPQWVKCLPRHTYPQHYFLYLSIRTMFPGIIHGGAHNQQNSIVFLRNRMSDNGFCPIYIHYECHIVSPNQWWYYQHITAMHDKYICRLQLRPSQVTITSEIRSV